MSSELSEQEYNWVDNLERVVNCMPENIRLSILLKLVDAEK
jgi:hypothetical protein